MSKYLFYEEIENGIALITTIHYMPELLTEEEKSQGILVDDIPNAEEIEGKSTRLMMDINTKEMWYEYEDIPLTPEQIIQNQMDLLILQTQDLQIALAEIMGGD